MSYHLFDFVRLAVPLHIQEIQRDGGPRSEQLQELASRLPVELGERGDVMLFGGDPGVPARMVNDVARAIALMAFQPGGITVFDEHWETVDDQ